MEFILYATFQTLLCALKNFRSSQTELSQNFPDLVNLIENFQQSKISEY